MNIQQFSERAPSIETPYSPSQEAIILAVLLVAGLVFAVPTLATLTSLPTLLWVGVVGGIYGITVLSLQRVKIGLYVALLVTMTFAANVPLASDSYLSTFTRDLGPAIWLADIPLIGLALYLVTEQRREFFDFTLDEILLGIFIIWTVIAGILTNPPRLDATFYFSIFVLQGWLVLVTLRRMHEDSRITPTTTFGTLAIVVLCQAMFALVESINRGSFGFTRLGELSSRLSDQIAVISLGPLGTLPVGTFVAGFSGMSFIIGSLIVLVLPFVVYYSIDHTDWLRLGGFLTTAILLAVLRLTGTDAGRGGAILALSVLFGLIAYQQYQRRTFELQQVAYVTFIFVICFSIILVPSTNSGAVSHQSASLSDSSPTEQPPSDSSEDHSSSDSSKEQSSFDSSKQKSPNQPSFKVTDISLPFFDLSNLGVRLQQYIAGILTFQKSPILGAGAANFPYINEEYGINSNLPIHNVYISLLAETGIIGFSLYVSFLLVILWKGFKSTVLEIVDQDRIIVSSVAAIIGYLGFMFWDYMLFDSLASSFTFYTVCAILSTAYEDQDISSMTDHNLDIF